MHIDIPDHLGRRLEHLTKVTGQDVRALVCEAIAQRLIRDERLQPPQEVSTWPPLTDQDPLGVLIGSWEENAPL